MKKNILHIIYQTNIIWWVENFLSTLLWYSQDNNILVQVYNKKNNTWIKNKIINLDEKLHSYNPLILIYQLFSRAYKYKKTCTNEKISISVSHGDSLNLSNIASKIFFWNKSSIYIFLHNSLTFYTNTWSWFYKYLFIYFYPKADKVITVSKEMYEELKSQGFKNVEYLYNPINIDSIQELQKESLWKHKSLFQKSKKTFITIGRLEKVKNIDFLIDNFHQFNLSNPNYQFIIIWDWEEQKKLKNKIQKLQNSNIHLLWRQSNVYNFLSSSNYFLSSSLNEWFWRVLIEALACWVPVLTHDFKYWAKEIIRNNNDFSDCEKVEIHENWILTPYLDKENYIKSLNMIVTTSFDKNIMMNNIEKYKIQRLYQNWENLLCK